MATQHEFQPIDSPTSLDAAIEYIAVASQSLAETVLGNAMNIDTVCLFAQSAAEYQFLRTQIESRGPRSRLSHDATTYVDTGGQYVAGQFVSLLGFREPDATRPEVGYADYAVDNYQAMLRRIAGNAFAQPTRSRTGRPLIELRHPDFDIRGYVVQKSWNGKSADSGVA